MKKMAAVAFIMLLAACSEDSSEEPYTQKYDSVDPEEWPNVVATVNGEEIHKNKIEADFVDYTNAYEQAASSTEEEQLMVYERILTQLLTSEIETELLLQAAEAEEIYVTDDELQEAILDLRLEEGIESDEEYEEVIRAGNMTVEEYEEQIKEDLLRFKFLDSEQGSPNITEEQINEAYEVNYGETDIELDVVRNLIVAELEADYRQNGAARLFERLREEASITLFIERD